MSDEQTPRSGSRWEPAPDDATLAPPAPPPVPAADPYRDVSSGAPAAPADRPTWTQRARNRGGLLGAGLALVLAGGIGGYAISHAEGHAPFGLVSQQAPGAPAGGLPAGQLPPPRHGDDGGGFGTPPGSDDDGGGASGSGSTL
jgi:hypothetical protein